MNLSRRIAVVALALGASLVTGQAPIRDMAAPDAVSASPFSLVRGARELPDGRLIVTDYLEQRVDGPRPCRRGAWRVPAAGPAAVVPCDSTLLVDMGNGRLGARRGWLHAPDDRAAS